MSSLILLQYIHSIEVVKICVKFFLLNILFLTFLNEKFLFAAVGDVLIREGTERPTEFSLPVLFEPTVNGVKASPLEFRYDISHEGEIYVGPNIYGINSFIVSYFESKDQQNFLGTLENASPASALLLIKWPREFVESGILSVVNTFGAVLWELEIREKDIREWKEYLEEKKEHVKKPNMAYFFESTYGLRGVPEDFLEKVSGSFRFCLTAKQNQYQSSVCTQRYSLRKESSFYILKRHNDHFAPQVFINQKHAAVKGSVPVLPGDMFSFFAQASNGIIYETVTSPINPNLLEMVNHPEQNAVSIYGYEPIPFGDVEVLHNEKREDFFTRFLWGQTIGDLRKYWTRMLPKDKPYLYYPGYSGAWFVQEYSFPETFPSEKNRVYISNRESSSTYSEHKILHGYMPEGTTVTSQQEQALPDTDNKQQFVWNFSSPKLNDWNRSTLTIHTPDGEYGGLFEIYKGYNKEISTRLSGVLGKSGSTYLGELAFNWWFEDLFNLDSYWLSKQRWGLNVRAFKSVAPITFQGATKDSSGNFIQAKSSNLDLVSLDLRYRFNPGLWGRDESWGFLMSSQNVAIMNTSLNALGGGIFWARSMPPIFDQWLSELPLMKAPKFVDFDFSIYPVSARPNTKMGTNYSLNFHGKVFWTHEFFGEAALSWKRINFINQDIQRDVNFGALFLTAGLGFNF
jgi:hypothetical protein